MHHHHLIIKVLLLLSTSTTILMAYHYPNNNHQTNNYLHYDYGGREKRATKKPGFIKTLFSVIYEQWSDTRNTYNKVNTLINDNFLPDNPPRYPTTTLKTSSNESTTKPPYKITRKEFGKIVQRNLRGLIRLFNIELQDALKQSDKNYKQYRKNATLEISKFL